MCYRLLVVTNMSTLFLILIIVSACVYTGDARPARKHQSPRDLAVEDRLR